MSPSTFWGASKNWKWKYKGNQHRNWSNTWCSYIHNWSYRWTHTPPPPTNQPTNIYGFSWFAIVVLGVLGVFFGLTRFLGWVPPPPPPLSKPMLRACIGKFIVPCIAAPPPFFPRSAHIYMYHHSKSKEKQETDIGMI